MRRHFSRYQACKGNSKYYKDLVHSNCNELHEEVVKKVDLNTLHIDDVLLITEGKANLSLRDVENDLPFLMMNITGITLMSIVDTG